VYSDLCAAGTMASVSSTLCFWVTKNDNLHHGYSPSTSRFSRWHSNRSQMHLQAHANTSVRILSPGFHVVISCGILHWSRRPWLMCNFNSVIFESLNYSWTMATCGVRQSSRSLTEIEETSGMPSYCGWRLSSGTWNPVTYPWMEPLTFLRIVHCGDWCLYVYCYTLLMMKWWRWWLFAVERLIIVWFLSPYQIEWCRFIFVDNMARKLNYILY